ncbi:hypothetical protein BCR39DRAFT_508444 [Naematelia encephala]|uniref:Uncharacterized protein n=1 Tax=Naematelia encephala TaxID=71784 RepID=A0A1Y2AFE1_9TREE|nr:hypothetical protein BCR39DRAFT_508444 [Naematelia encephala]
MAETRQRLVMVAYRHPSYPKVTKSCFGPFRADRQRHRDRHLPEKLGFMKWLNGSRAISDNSPVNQAGNISQEEVVQMDVMEGDDELPVFYHRKLLADQNARIILVNSSEMDQFIGFLTTPGVRNRSSVPPNLRHYVDVIHSASSISQSIHTPHSGRHHLQSPRDCCFSVTQHISEVWHSNRAI